MNLQQNRIKNLFQERLNYFFGEKGNVNYIRSRVMEREFVDDSNREALVEAGRKRREQQRQSKQQKNNKDSE